MRPYGKKFVGGLCGYSDNCGEEAPRRWGQKRRHRKPSGRIALRALKRRARAAGVRDIQQEAR
jgi:hypothetical protein